MIFRDSLEQAVKDGLFRSLRLIEDVDGVKAVIGGKNITLFCSNDYLGLSGHPSVRQAAIECIGKNGWGAGASRLISGTRGPHAELEDKIASWLAKPAALMYGNGFAANMGVLTAALGRGDKVFLDRLCHASLIDGARFSGAKIFRFAHNDPASLEKLLAKEDGKGEKLVVTEGVFSMDGDVAPLKKIAETAKKHGAALMIDDAHGFGVFGPEGKGTVYDAGIEEMVDILVVTLGKALGGAGGVTLGSRDLIDGLVNFSRPFIYSTAPPPAVAAAGSAAIDIVRGVEGDALRKTLFTNIKSARATLKELGINTASSESQIIPVMAGSEKSAMAISRALFDGGVLAPAIRPPTVPKGTERIRLSISSSHTEEDLAKLFEILKIVRTSMNDYQHREKHL